MRKNLIEEKSFLFSLSIIKIYKYLQEEKKEYIISKQLLRSGTSIGANISEAIEAYSKKEFNCKMYIALKESSESKYWIKLLKESNYISSEQSVNLLKDIEELYKILRAITKTKTTSANLSE
ncbi:MAG: four helix bundle protein [Sarcina sp.]